MIFSYDKIYDHKFPVTQCTISADRKTRKMQYRNYRSYDEQTKLWLSYRTTNLWRFMIITFFENVVCRPTATGPWSWGILPRQPAINNKLTPKPSTNPTLTLT